MGAVWSGRVEALHHNSDAIAICSYPDTCACPSSTNRDGQLDTAHSVRVGLPVVGLNILFNLAISFNLAIAIRDSQVPV